VSTLSISIIALVVFVVGLVLLFNLWQARTNRRLLEEDERFDERLEAPRGRPAGRGDARREARAKPTGRGWSASEDRNAWARQRREPTMLADDASPAPAWPTQSSAADEPDPRTPQRGATGYMSAADEDEHSLEREERAYEAARERVEREDEELLPDPDEDLGPPQFEAPRLDPVPPEPLPSEHATRGPRLDPARLDPRQSEPSPGPEPRPAPAGFENTRPFRPGLVDTGNGVAAPVAVNSAVVAALSGSAPRGPSSRVDPGAGAGEANDESASSAPQGDLPDYLPAAVDYVVTLIPRTPVNAERLVALTSSLRHVGSKAIRIEIDGGQGRWVPLHSGAMVGCLRCSVLLANRQGPLHAVELSDFSAAMESLAAQIGARFVPPDLNQVLRQARDLDGLAARLDTQVDLGVEASAPVTPQKLAAVARKLDLFDRGSNRYACFAEGGELLYTLMPGDTEDMLTFVLDVPRTAPEHDAWRSIVACASSCAQMVGGRVVDSAGRGMSVGMIDTVGLQIQKRYRELENVGLRAGSPEAMRVFN
jgi:FtsZ-interacting cell division protein ZipA